VISVRTSLTHIRVGEPGAGLRRGMRAYHAGKRAGGKARMFDKSLE